MIVNINVGKYDKLFKGINLNVMNNIYKVFVKTNN